MNNRYDYFSDIELRLLHMGLRMLKPLWKVVNTALLRRLHQLLLSEIKSELEKRMGTSKPQAKDDFFVTSPFEWPQT